MAVIIEEGRRLYPVVVQDEASGRVLMVAFADDVAIQATRDTNLAHFYSRTRRTIWQKGETSGHILPVVRIVGDCDADSYLYVARPQHPVCHRGTSGCFDEAPANFDLLATLAGWIHERAHGPADSESYTQRLALGGLDRMLKKIAEESGEVIIAALSPGPDQSKELVWESADLLFHLVAVWERMGITLEDVAEELRRRHRV